MKPAQRAAKVKQTLQHIHAGYQVGFAGQPRLTRSPGQLDAWVTQLKSLSTQIRALPPGSKAELMELTKRRIKLYQAEATAIREAQQMNAFSQVAYGYIEWANLQGDRYQRHFAGQSRNTRDGNLLSELIVDAQVWTQQAQDHLNSSKDELSTEALTDLESRIERMRESEEMYQSELKAITESQQKSGTAQERADLFAYLANRCFETYRAHFADQPRSSRRLSTLERVNTQLEVISDQMASIISHEGDQLEDRSRAERNLEIVRNNLESYQKEERSIDQAQLSLDYDGWVDTLSKAGEAVYQSYSQHFANQPRKDCDPELLCMLCDRLYDIACQLRPFVEYSTELEERSQLLVMLDQLRLYHRELVLVRQATQQDKASDPER